MQVNRGIRSFSYEFVVLGILFLFFFQLIADFVEAIYAFGLLGTSIPAEIVSVLLLFTPLLLFFWPRGWGSSVLITICGSVMLGCRMVEVLLDTRGRMILSGIGVGCFLLLWPVLIWRQSRQGEMSAGFKFGAGPILAVGLSILFRAWGSGTDLTTIGMFKSIGWLLAVLAGALLFILVRKPSEAGWQEGRAIRDQRPPPRSRIALLSLGMTSVLALLYFAFTSPNVIARWTGANYVYVEIVVLLALSLFGLLFSSQRHYATLVRSGILWSSNVLFVASLVWTIVTYQIRFPADPAGYPFAEPAVSWWQYLPLSVMLLTFPIMLLDFSLFARELVTIRPSWRDLAVGFTLASLLMLVLILGQVFTTVYDYIPVIGPLFRDRFWLVFLIPGIIMLLALGSIVHTPFGQAGGMPRSLVAVVAAISLAAVAGVLLVSARPSGTATSDGILRVLTYNIQQGYSAHGQKNFDGQLKLIRQVDADVIGLQESDTNRIAGGNNDVVRYFADGLDLYSYYGPKVVPGTFGIALLSKYPIENPRTFYMYSEGEQTATIEAQINVNGRLLHIFVTHLGNGGPIVQQEAILQEVAGKENVVLMGDFNFRPNSEQYALTTTALVDAWLLKWPDGQDDQGVNPARRIDHIFVSLDLSVRDISLLDSPASDHPAVTADLEW